MKRHLITLLKIVLSLGIVAYLVYDIKRSGAVEGRDVFSDLIYGSKNWGYLALAIGFCFSAVLFTMIRWHFLLRALDIPTKFLSTLRIAFVGYFFNLAPLGIAGGDLVRVMLINGKHENIKAKSIASVVLDRVIGLYMLFVVASVAIWFAGFHGTAKDPIILTIHGMTLTMCEMTWLLAIVGGVVAAILMIPSVTEGRLANSLGKLPGIGGAMASLLEAIRMYRRRPGVLLLASLLTVGVHSFFAIGVYMIARWLPGPDHTISTHMVIMPLSASAGAIPLSIGPFEAVLEYFYYTIPLAVGTMMKGQGFVTALGYRLITVLIALVGAICYFKARREVSQAMHDVEETREESSLEDGPNIALSQEQSAA
ncbi:MAG: lysylphosphatidylglycerol synthase transmembrane domain-containing protein [Planctomycetia bacterium]|jgi:uncharacterized protein (TIRG00374 family)